MKKRKFYIFQEELIKMEIDRNGVCITDLVRMLNMYAMSDMKKLRTTQITDYLVRKGYLQEECGNRRPTKRGAWLGITVQERKNENKEVYWLNMYGEKAQRYIYDHLYEMIE